MSRNYRNFLQLKLTWRGLLSTYLCWSTDEENVIIPIQSNLQRGVIRKLGQGPECG